MNVRVFAEIYFRNREMKPYAGLPASVKPAVKQLARDAVANRAMTVEDYGAYTGETYTPQA